jgi:hypothetical protein
MPTSLQVTLIFIKKCQVDLQVSFKAGKESFWKFSVLLFDESYKYAYIS